MHVALLGALRVMESPRFPFASRRRSLSIAFAQRLLPRARFCEPPKIRLSLWRVSRRRSVAAAASFFLSFRIPIRLLARSRTQIEVTFPRHDSPLPSAHFPLGLFGLVREDVRQ